MKSELEIAITTLKQCETRLDKLSNAMTAYETRLSVAEGEATEVVELKREVETQETTQTR